MGDRKNKLQEKNKLAALDKELNELETEFNLLYSRVEELEEDVKNTQGDIKNRVEQIGRKTEELMSQNEKIKALDDEKEELKLKLSGEVTDNSGEQLNELMNELQSARQYGTRPKNTSEAVMGDLAKMAQLMGRMQLRAETMKKTDDMMMAEEAILLNNSDTKRNEGVVNQVRVWFGHTSCLFKITDNHTFKMLLDEVLTYWSLEPAKNVLVNESNFVWPLNATIREVLAGSSSNAKIKVKNREAEAEAKFSWVSHAAKVESDRKVDEDAEEAEKLVLDLLQSEEKEKEQTIAGFLDGDKAFLKKTNNPDITKQGHLPGMDISRSTDTQLLKIQESIHVHPTQVDIVRYLRLLVFLAFIVLASNTLFMRRAVYKANMLHAGLSSVFFDDFLVTKTPDRASVLAGGYHVGTQGLSRLPEKPTKLKLNFNNIDNFNDVWKWIEGPFRSAVTGMRNGSATTTVNSTVSWAPEAKKGSTILRHNTIIGRPRLHQIRSETSGCVKPSKYDIFQADCISLFDSSKNQEKGIRTTAECISSGKQDYECKVGLDDNGEVMYTVDSIDSNGMYTLSGGGKSLSNVPRYRIINSSWPQLYHASVASRYSIYKTTTGFTFNEELQKKIDESTYYSMALSYFADYKGGGFTTDIPLDVEGYDLSVGTLKRHWWLDKRTRALRVTVNTYNPSYDMIAIVEALIEFPASGGVKPSYSVKTFRATDNWTVEDKSRASMEAGLIFLIVFVAIDLVYNWFLEFSMPVDEYAATVQDLYDTEARRKKERRERRKVKSQEETLNAISEFLPKRIIQATLATLTPWKIVDLIIIGLFIAQYAVRGGYLITNGGTLTKEVFDGDTFTDFQKNMLQYKVTINIDVILIFLTTTKTFKFFSYNPNISMIWIVLQRAAVTFVHSFYVYFIYVSAFTFAGYIIFGIENDRYIAYDVAYNQVLSMLSGKFNYAEMAETNPWLAPMYYVVICTFGYLFLKNVFVAIVNDEYQRKATDVRMNGYYWIRTEADFLADENRRKAKELEKYTQRKNKSTGLGQAPNVVVGDNRIK
jgi:hypothetical protein